MILSVQSGVPSAVGSNSKVRSPCVTNLHVATFLTLCQQGRFPYFKKLQELNIVGHRMADEPRCINVMLQRLEGRPDFGVVGVVTYSVAVTRPRGVKMRDSKELRCEMGCCCTAVSHECIFLVLARGSSQYMLRQY